ncbi:ATP-binding cassette domain-containing protein [Porphyrobacter sp. YT40]|uniref:ABC transporter ATP-binding protein n=1 Tax=Porphyrobacter sp. YT40 TaxID=2547601 RepID=UPI0015E8E7D1|nr:ATP-binding cassette domain-containing protein [Porphyrobacter sp. YT40]
MLVAEPLARDACEDAVTGFARPLVLEGIAHAASGAQGLSPLTGPLTRRFAPGTFHVVAGPPGAGKTTLLSILALALRPMQGSVLWGEFNLTRLSTAGAAAWRRQNLGLIAQSQQTVGVLTVREHVRLSGVLRGMPEAEAEGLALLGMLGMGRRLTQVGGELSGADKQRLAIAQALCARPSVLLADQPTAALDQASAGLVAETLRDYARDRGAVVICVSHDPVVIEAADDLVMLRKG